MEFADVRAAGLKSKLLVGFTLSGRVGGQWQMPLVMRKTSAAICQTPSAARRRSRFTEAKPFRHLTMAAAQSFQRDDLDGNADCGGHSRKQGKKGA